MSEPLMPPEPNPNPATPPLQLQLPLPLRPLPTSLSPAPLSPALPSPASPASLPATATRVLVADDHPIVRSGIVALLGATDDLQVVGEATTGLEAVELALALQPDVVLMDLRMPGLNGDEATARILAQRPGIRVLVLTTYESDDSILTAIEAGASGYLLKAAPQEELLAGIRSVARGEVALAPRIAALLVSRMQRPAGPTLSARETEVLRLVAQGLSNPAIAKELFLAEATIKTHLLHVFEKLEVNDRTRAVTKAMELGLL